MRLHQSDKVTQFIVENREKTDGFLTFAYAAWAD